MGETIRDFFALLGAATGQVGRHVGGVKCAAFTSHRSRTLRVLVSEMKGQGAMGGHHTQ